MAASVLTATGQRRREALTGYLFISPAVLLIGLFGMFPVLFTVYVSLFKWRIRRGTFLGLANYAEMFGGLLPFLLVLAAVVLAAAGTVLLSLKRTKRSPVLLAPGVLLLLGGVLVAVWALPQMYALGDEDLLDSLRVTVWYSAGTVPVQLTLGLLVAVMLNQKLGGKQAFRVIYLLPYIVPTVASAAVFERLFSLRSESLANQVVKLLGIRPLQWLGEAKGIFLMMSGGRMPMEATGEMRTYWLSWGQGPSLALVSIMIYSWWVFIGYYALIYTNGLSNIPRQLYEAAEVDGASKVSSFFRITVPLLSPTTYFLTLLGIIGTFKVFNHVYVMRNYAIGGAADTVSIEIFFTFFRKQRFGYAAASSLLLFAIVIGLTVVQRRFMERRVTYGD